MSTVLSAKTRIEIYRVTKIFTDHFLEQHPTTYLPLWNPPVGAGLDGYVSRGEDAVTLTVPPGYGSLALGTTYYSFNGSTSPLLVVRVNELTGSAWKVNFYTGGSWVNAASGVAAGIFEVDTSAFGACTGVEVVVEGSPGQLATFDLLSVCSELVVPADGDLVDELRITLPTLKDGVQGAKFALNSKVAYADVAEHDAVVIYLGRSGESGTKRFGGRIRKLQVESVNYGEEYLHVWCHSHGYELQTPPGKFTASYATATNGKTIIEAALNLCRYLAKYPHGVGWFDTGGPFGSTDDRIQSVHAVDFDFENPYGVVTQVAEDADNGAVEGFDLYETPSGCVAGHLRGSLDFTCAVVPVLQHCLDTLDACPVGNRISVFGAKNRSEPSGGDDWTLDVLGNWTEIFGVLSEGTQSPPPFEPSPLYGSNCLKCTSALDGSHWKAWFKRVLPEPISGMGKLGYGKLNFATYYPVIPTIKLYVVLLLAPDASNYFQYYLSPEKAEQDKWQEMSLALGQSNEKTVKNPNGVWVRVGNANWTNITAVEFRFTFEGLQFKMFLDGLNFGEGAYRATANHTASQAEPWGIIEADPESDASLQSDDDCLLRANSILASIAYSQRLIDPVIVDGDPAYLPSFRCYVKGAYHVLREVVDVVRDNVWTAELKI